MKLTDLIDLVNTINDKKAEGIETIKATAVGCTQEGVLSHPECS